LALIPNGYKFYKAYLSSILIPLFANIKHIIFQSLTLIEVLKQVVEIKEK